MSDAEVVEEPLAEEKKPARPARRRTAKASDQQEAAASSAASGSAEAAPSDSEAASAEEKPKRRRTVRKKAESDSSAEPAVEEQAEEKKPRRTRAKAAKPQEGDDAKAEPAASGGAPSGEEAAEEPKPKKPRGRAKAKKEEAPAEEVASELQQAQESDSVSDNPAETGADAPAAAESSASSEEKHGEEREERKSRNRQRKQRQQKNGEGHQKNDRSNRNDRGDRNDRNDRQKNDRYHNNRRQHQQNRREPVVPQTSKEELAKLKVAELREKAQELEVEFKGLKKAELVEAVFVASVKAEGFEEVSGILDVLPDGYGFLRTSGYLPGEKDVYVGTSTIRRNHLRKGDYLTGQTRPARPKEKFAALQRVDTVNGTPLDELGKRVRFADLTPVFPDERLVLEHGRSSITSRVIDLCAPIGKGQRGLIVSPPKAGKTTILKDIAASITANNPEVHLMCLLVDERPEEVTDMERSIHGEVISSTFDMPCENHVAVSEMVIERAKRLVENGQDVVILLDSLTRLARAYNLAQPASGRILSGGVDSTALYPPKKFLGAARNIEGGGSLTILASALIETGSKMDEVIFEEFKGTGNMEVKLDRSLAEHRIFPAIDPVASGTRREDLLIDPQEAPLIWAVRRVLANRNNVERAMDSLIKSLKQTNDNQEFLMRAAKKAQQGRHFDENGTIEI